MQAATATLTAVGTFLLTVACAGAPTAPDPPLSDLTSAPTSVTIGGKSLTLAASLWRDFMPVVQPAAAPVARPLNGLLRLTPADASPLPDGIQVSGAWIVNGTEIWTPSGPLERRPNPSAYEVVLRGGPAWPAGTTVEVVVELSAGTERVLLRRAAVSIEAVN